MGNKLRKGAVALIPSTTIKRNIQFFTAGKLALTMGIETSNNAKQPTIEKKGAHDANIVFKLVTMPWISLLNVKGNASALNTLIVV